MHASWQDCLALDLVGKMENDAEEHGRHDGDDGSCLIPQIAFPCQSAVILSALPHSDITPCSIKGQRHHLLIPLHAVDGELSVGGGCPHGGGQEVYGGEH